MMFECDKCDKRLKCELTDYKNKMITRYKRSTLFDEFMNIMNNKSIPNWKKCLKIGAMQGRQRYDWQWAFVRDMIDNLKPCILHQIGKL